jgi:hypothetical protein
MLETVIRFTSPIPASSNALSNELSLVGPSALPEIMDTFILTTQNLNREKTIGNSICSRVFY